ncbi:MAG: hypothetical protein WBO95_08225, partial [Candidatus Dechloromonas phosphoritropha]
STSMDLSIRVIALIRFATRVASHQDTHTYRLSKFLKINIAPPKKRRQQQRSGIIQYPQQNVKTKSIKTDFTNIHFQLSRNKSAWYLPSAQLAGCGGRI